jgi:hypothetical protein
MIQLLFPCRLARLTRLNPSNQGKRTISNNFFESVGTGHCHQSGRTAESHNADGKESGQWSVEPGQLKATMQMEKRVANGLSNQDSLVLNPSLKAL